MTNETLFHKAMPGSLAGSVQQARPALPMDDTVRLAVGNWVAHDQTTSRLAESMAEPHLHRYLEEAERIGRSHGWVACLVVWWPLTVVVLVASILVLTRS
jgi:hypothetical protein